MTTLLLRLAGPLQSWGYRSRYSDRDTGLEPTKSGVVGLLCCALGRRRCEPPTDLATLSMHVRVDRQGTLLKDYHTAGGGVFRGRMGYFAPTSKGELAPVFPDPTKPQRNCPDYRKLNWNSEITERHYLQDASFLVALETENDRLLRDLAEAIADPRWPLALGRRSCPPGEPVLVGIADQEARRALSEHPLRLHRNHLPRCWDEREGRYAPDLTPQRLRLVLECARGDIAGEMRRDVPVAWPDQLTRDYTIRYVRSESIEKVPEVAP